MRAVHIAGSLGLLAGLWGALGIAPARAQAEPCAGDGPRLAGIDVSSYQGEIDWRRVKAAGVVFAFARAADGTALADEQFARNFAGMKRAKVLRGAYQVFRASVDPDDQADLLIARVRRLGRADLPLVADVETADGMDASDLRDRLARWLRRVERRTRRRPIIYTSPAMSELVGGAFGGHPLWVAHYEVECPRLPAGWERWTFWQRSSSGQVAGVTGPVDLDVFAGRLAELRKLGKPRRVALARRN